MARIIWATHLLFPSMLSFQRPRVVRVWIELSVCTHTHTHQVVYVQALSIVDDGTSKTPTGCTVGTLLLGQQPDSKSVCDRFSNTTSRFLHPSLDDVCQRFCSDAL